MDIASLRGLEGLSIGSLAQVTGISKSGLFASFGSKEDLQLATIDAARERFAAAVLRPALEGTRGLERVWSLCARWGEYAESEVFPGGCFFMQVSVEFDNRPGAVRDRIAETMARWTSQLESAIEGAKRAGEIRDAVNARQLAFTVNAMGMGANLEFQLQRDKASFELASRAIRDQLGLAATSTGRRKLSVLASRAG
jgi:AcrR family transcriptional regulator